MGLRSVSDNVRCEDDEGHTRVELRVCKELDEVLPIARDYVVALEVQSYVAKRIRITVDIQCPHFVGTAAIVV